MMTNFSESFGNDSASNRKISQEVLDELNRDLPDNLMYYCDDQGQYQVLPKPGINSVKLNVLLDVSSEKDLSERLNDVPPTKWLEYLYRTQRSCSIKSPQIGNEKELIPIERTIGNPLDDQAVVLDKCRMYPAKFPDPINYILETVEGEQVNVKFQQQKYDSVTEVKFKNVTFPALNIEIYLFDPLTEKTDKDAKTSKDKKVCVNYSVTPQKAVSVNEAIAALHIFKGLFEGTVKVNGKVMTSKDVQTSFNKDKVDDALTFWTTAAALEKKIGVSFIPGSDFPMDDVRFFSELDVCFNNEKAVFWKHPFDHFHISDIHDSFEKMDAESILGNPNLKLNFLEGPIEATLLGAKFVLYSKTTFSDFIITNIEYDDSDKKGCEIYLSDAPDKIWKLQRLFITESQAKELRKQSDLKKEDK